MQSSNNLCNNAMFSGNRIPGMHDQMKRLYKAAEELKGVSGQSDVARLMNASPQTLNNWEVRGISKAGMIKAQETVGCSATWLETGKGKMRVGLVDNTMPGPEIRGTVPLISWVQAGNFAEAIDQLQPGQGDRIETTIPIKAHTYALRVTGDSMEPDFPDGCIIIVEPEMEPCHGDYVIVKNGHNEATFKQLIQDGADLYLKPMNPRYPVKPMPKGAVFCGVVRGMERRFR